VDGHQGARALGRGGFELRGVEVVGARLDVHEAGARARARDGPGGGEEGEGRGQDLAPSAHVEREQGEEDGVGARAAADGVRRVRVAREFGFEQPHVLAEDELLRVEDAFDRRAQLFAQRGVLCLEVKERYVHRLSRSVWHARAGPPFNL
jgi:hypothetical protein